MTTTTRRTPDPKLVAAADKALTQNAPRNPATTKSPTTGKVRGPARKPLPATANAGLKAPAKPAATKAPAKKVAKPAPKAAPKPTPEPKADSAGVLRRSLAARLIGAAALEFADDSDADKQKVANWLKVVTSGIDENGKRIWPTDILPRPTHFSWDA